jgi:ApeA N-terminal domain 1
LTEADSQEFNVTGEWWFPNDEIKFNGNMTFDSNRGGKLVIFGSLDQFALSDSSGRSDEKTREAEVCRNEAVQTLVLGDSTDKQRFTIISRLPPSDRSVIKDNYSYREREFKIDVLFAGIHFNKLDDIIFENVLVEYSHFNEWIADAKLRGRTIFDSNDDKYSLEHYYGEEVDVDILGLCSIKIKSYPDIQGSLVNRQIQEHTFVKISSSEQKSLEYYVYLKNLFSDFLNFVIVDEVITLRLVGNVRIQVDSRYFFELVQIFYQSTILKDMDKVKVLSNSLLKYTNIGQERFNDILNSWFRLRSRVAAVYDLYFGVMYNPELYLSNKFLMLAEAISIYFDQILTKTNDPDLRRKSEQIEKVCNVLDESDLDSEIKDWSKNIIKEKKSLSFKQKMQKAYETYRDLLPHLSHVIGSKEEFSSMVTQFRNDLTHRNIDYNQVDNDKLFWKFRDLQLILQLCILSELGFSVEEMKAIYYVGHKETNS